MTWVATYTDEQGQVVGRQLFRILKFDPSTLRSGLMTHVEGKAKGTVDATAEAGQGATEVRVGEPGEELPPFVLDVTPTVVVAGAIASRDFMPVHHDRDYAVAQGAPDIFMNILTTNGYVARFVTDWAGPHAFVRKIAIRLGAPAIPGQDLRFTGQVSSRSDEGDECVIEVAIRAANDLGDHATGSVIVTLPLG